MRYNYMLCVPSTSFTSLKRRPIHNLRKTCNESESMAKKLPRPNLIAVFSVSENFTTD
jgi:hypothetical protein